MILVDLFFFLITSDALSMFKGSEATAYITLLTIAVAVYILHKNDKIDAKAMWLTYLAIFILLAGAWSAGYVVSGRAADDLREGSAAVEADMKNSGVKESFVSLLLGQYQRGTGEYLGNADVEQTHEFIGVKIEGAEPFKEEFYSNEPVHVDIDYTANSYFPIQIATSCKIKGVADGKVEPRITKVSKSQPARVRCTFENMPKGHHVVDVTAVYTYESTVRIPLKFMEQEFSETLLLLSKDSGNGITPESYVGGTQNPLTNSGPIAFGVSNTRKDGVSVLQMPILLERENMNKFSSRLKLQIQEQELNGGINSIEKATFNVPAGLLLEDCDFLPEGKNDLGNPFGQLGDRWNYTVETDFSTWGDFTSLSCQLAFNQLYVDYFLPSQMKWSPQTIFFTMQYQYRLEHAVPVEVTA